MLAEKCAQHRQKDFIQVILTPVYNVLRDLSGLNPQALPPLEHHIDNDKLIDQSQKANKANQISFEMKLLLTISQAFYLRDFEKAQRMAQNLKMYTRKGGRCSTTSSLLFMLGSRLVILDEKQRICAGTKRQAITAKGLKWQCLSRFGIWRTNIYC